MSRKEIERVYVGLPKHLVLKVKWSPRPERTHPWSHLEGGWDVIVEFIDGRVRGYDWVKIPHRYIQKFFQGHTDYTHTGICKLFARNYLDKDDYFKVGFEEIWNIKNTDDIITAMSEFERKQNIRNIKNGKFKAQPRPRGRVVEENEPIKVVPYKWISDDI